MLLKPLQESHFTLFRLGCAGLCGLFILLALLHKEPINPDGLLYLQASQTYLAAGLKASVAIFPWPFITLTFAYTHKLTHLSLIHSAYLLNILLAMTFVWGFVTLARTLFATPTITLAAGLLIALYPELNRTALLITRDLGYWAFSLMALLALLAYIKQPRWIWAGLFGATQLLATLYRSEGIVLLTCLPFALFLIPTLPRKIFHFLRCQTILLLLLIAVIGWISTHPQATDSWHHLQRLTDPLIHIKEAWIKNWATKIHAIHTYALEPNAQENGFLILLGGSILVCFNAIIKATNGFYFLLSLYGLFKRKITTWPAGTSLLILFFTLHFFIAAGFAAQHQFLPPRYAVLCCVLFLLFAAKGLAHLFQSHRFLIKIIISIGLITLALGDTFHTGPSKRYLIEAGEWLKQQPDTTVFSNSPQVIYYADRPLNYKGHLYTDEQLAALIKSNQWQSYHYIAIRLPHQDKLPTPFATMQAVVSFSNKRHDRVIIFKTK